MGNIGNDLKKLFSIGQKADAGEANAGGAGEDDTFQNAQGAASDATGAQDAAQAAGGDEEDAAVGAAVQGDGAAGETQKEDKVAALEAQLAEMQKGMAVLTKQLKEATEAESKDVIPKFEFKETDFIADDAAFESLTTDKKAFNEALNKAAQYGANLAVQHLAASMPALVTKVSTQQANTTYMINDFWRANKDIAQFADSAAKASELFVELEEQNPHKTLPELFEMLPRAFRQKYMPKQQNQQQQQTPRKPSQVGGTGTRADANKTKPSEISTLLGQMAKVR